MSAKTISLRIEALLVTVDPSMYNKSNEILIHPYKEIISSLEQRTPKQSLDKFKLYYQAIEAKSLQELVDDEYYDVEQLIKDLRGVIEEK